MGGDCPGKTELRRGVLETASVFVEFEPRTRIEGDLQQSLADFAVTELWRVPAGLAPGRLTADQVTAFDSAGFALEDYSALTWMGEVAADLGIGAAIELVPRARDPKDLFSVLHGATGANGAAAVVPSHPVAAALA